MKSSREIRADAWRKVVRTRWLWRLALVTIALNASAQLVMSVISGFYGEMEISTWTEFGKAKIAAAQQGLDYAVPSLAAALQMTGASMFEMFMTYIFGAIFTLGVAAASLKAVAGDEEKWLFRSFEGFRRPLEAAWLLFLINFKVMLWSLLFLVPGLVAAYRYRQAWYLKAGNPDWSASKCIAESGRMMDGFKWKAFVLDLSYFGWFFFAGTGVGAAVLSGNAIATGCAMAGAVFILCYFFAGRAVFFRELADGS